MARGSKRASSRKSVHISTSDSVNRSTFVSASEVTDSGDPDSQQSRSTRSANDSKRDKGEKLCSVSDEEKYLQQVMHMLLNSEEFKAQFGGSDPDEKCDSQASSSRAETERMPDGKESSLLSTRRDFPKYKMADGDEIMVDVINGSDEDRLHPALYVLTQDARDEDNMVIGFDTEWCISGLNDKLESHVVLLKFCTRRWCILVRLNPTSKSYSPVLSVFLLLKDIVFAGVHLKEDLENLKTVYGLVLRNAVDVGELAANVLGQPRLAAYGVRDLARKVLSFPLEQRGLRVTWEWNWFSKFLTPEQLECAAIDTYALYRIGCKLLVDDDD